MRRTRLRVSRRSYILEEQLLSTASALLTSSFVLLETQTRNMDRDEGIIEERKTERERG